MDMYEIQGIKNDTLVIICRGPVLELLLNKSENQMLIKIATDDLIKTVEDMKNGKAIHN